MDVADDALAVGDTAGEAVRDRMAGFGFGNRPIGRVAIAAVAVLRVWPGVVGVAVVRVDDVAGRAARRAVVAGVVICPEK